MGIRYYSWEPPEHVTTHTGEEIGRHDEYFVEPPEEIGEVQSVSSTLTTKKAPTPVVLRLVFGFLGLLGGMAIGGGIGLFWKMDVIWLVLLPLLLGGLGFAIAWFSSGFEHNCTFVGDEGVAKYTCSGTRENITGEVFRFADATDLRTGQTRHYTNGVYQNTTYTFTWTDVGGRKRYSIDGSHKSEKGTPPDSDLFHYARAAEIAWSNYLLKDAQRQITTRGEVRFRLGGKNWVAVSEECLRLSLSGKVVECDVEEIRSVTIRDGMFAVRRTDAREGWFTTSGVFKFKYDELANAQLFMFVLVKLAGIEVE